MKIWRNFSGILSVIPFLVLSVAHAQVSSATVYGTCGTAVYPAGQTRLITQNTAGQQCTATTAVISGTSDVNLKQVNGATVNVGVGAASTGTQRVTTSTDSSTTANQGGTWTVQPGNTANTTAWKVDGSAVTQPISAAPGAFASGSQSIGITPTDRTVTSATGSSQTVMAANASRRALIFQNTGTTNCGINPTGGTAAIGGAGTLTLFPGSSYSPRIPTLSAVTAICTAGQPLYANEG